MFDDLRTSAVDIVGADLEALEQWRELDRELLVPEEERVASGELDDVIKAHRAGIEAERSEFTRAKRAFEEARARQQALEDVVIVDLSDDREQAMTRADVRVTLIALLSFLERLPSSDPRRGPGKHMFLRLRDAFTVMKPDARLAVKLSVAQAATVGEVVKLCEARSGTAALLGELDELARLMANDLSGGDTQRVEALRKRLRGAGGAPARMYVDSRDAEMLAEIADGACTQPR
jgi:hypothetical protein